MLLGLLLGGRAGAAESPPRRVASLNLAADEILAEILPAGRLVAVTSAADDPELSNVVGRFPAGLPRFFKADLERLVALRPDLVVVSEYTDADFLRLLTASGLRYHEMSGLHDLTGYRTAILALGEAVGEATAARRLVARYDARLAALRARLAGARRPRVLYWSDPYTAGAGTSMDSLIECGGGTNVGRALGLTGLVPVGAERAFAADPDVVLVGRFDAEADLSAHPLLSRLEAVRQGHVVRLPGRLLATVSQHAAEACWALAAALHPDRVSEPPP